MSPEMEYFFMKLGKGSTVLFGILVIGFVIARLIHSLSKENDGNPDSTGRTRRS